MNSRHTRVIRPPHESIHYRSAEIAALQRSLAAAADTASDCYAAPPDCALRGAPIASRRSAAATSAAT